MYQKLLAVFAFLISWVASEISKAKSEVLHLIQTAKSEVEQSMMGKVAAGFIAKGTELNATLLGGKTATELVASVNDYALSQISQAIEAAKANIRQLYQVKLDELEDKIPLQQLLESQQIDWAAKGKNTYQFKFFSPKGRTVRVVEIPENEDIEVNHNDVMNFAIESGKVIPSSILFFDDLTEQRFDQVTNVANDQSSRITETNNSVGNLSTLLDRANDRIQQLESREVLTADDISRLEEEVQKLTKMATA